MYNDIINPVLILLKFRLRALNRGLEGLPPGRKILVVIFGLMAFGFAYLLYAISRRVVGFLLAQPEVGEAILNYGVSTILSSLFFLLITSSAVTAVVTMYRHPETNWLLARPLPRLAIFLYKSVETAIYSAWILLLLASPIFMALFLELGASLPVILVSSFALVLLFGMATQLGVLLAFGFVRLFSLRSPRVRSGLVLLAILMMGLLYYRRQEGTRLLPDLQSYGAIQVYLGGLQTSSPWLPGSWVSQLMWAGIRGEWGTVRYLLYLLFSTCLFVFQLVVMGGIGWYQSLWWRLKDHVDQQGRWTRARLSRLALVSRPLALLEKDAKLFMRDPGQWMQTAMILGLFLVFLLVLRQVPVRFQAFEALYATPLAYMAFVSLGYMLTVLALRFVYPAVSLEGQAFWMLLTSPMRRSALLRYKLWPLMLLFLLSGFGLSRLMTGLLQLPEQIATLSLVASLSAALVIVLVTFAAGIFGTDLREKDPSKLASSVGAMMTTIALFIYLALVVVLLAVPFDQYYKNVLLGIPYELDFTRTVLLGLPASALLIGFILWRVARWSFARRDF